MTKPRRIPATEFAAPACGHVAAAARPGRRGARRAPLSLLLLGLLLPLLSACGGGGGGCAVRLANASSLPVEQVYVAPMGAPGWGPDQLAPATLAPGAGMPLRFAGRGRFGLRAVWTDGRAIEMHDVEACAISRVTLRDGAMQAE
ncbi:hypothetical protein [Roseicella frigidaeris]|uniref:Uncharacterized protein n=1 Tax=Roseicella frigidaeris TaxID=2230885 RepID=A0A327MEG6_9PROT|nr:hypothetical protein [Roseicella frigidaeris]RAI60925.1 hypothetical protein DOO78_01985 [Roseicella frigidaeris]